MAELPWADRRPATQLRAGRALRALARDWRPDVVHLHSAFAGVLGAAAVAGRGPTVYTPHASPVARTSDARLGRLAYAVAEGLVARRCTLVGAISEAEAEVVRDALRAHRVAVVQNGIPDLDPGARVAVPPKWQGRPTVLALGRIGPQRRPEESARVLAAVADLADVRWVGGAPGGEDAPLRAAGVPVTGWVPREAALEQVAAAEAVLHWSAWDGLSMSLLEAVAREAVVVASDIPANREVLGPGGVRATPDEAVALLRELLTDPAAREARLADQRARGARFGAARMVREWLALYGRLAA